MCWLFFVCFAYLSRNYQNVTFLYGSSKKTYYYYTVWASERLIDWLKVIKLQILSFVWNFLLAPKEENESKKEKKSHSSSSSPIIPPSWGLCILQLSLSFYSLNPFFDFVSSFYKKKNPKDLFEISPETLISFAWPWIIFLDYASFPWLLYQ